MAESKDLKLQLKRKDLESYVNKFKEFSEIKTLDKYFSFWIIKNLSNFKQEVEVLNTLRSTIQSPKEYIEYVEKKNKLLDTYIKTVDGKKQIKDFEINGIKQSFIEFKSESDKNAYDSEVKKLDEEYDVYIKENTVILETYNNVLNTDVEIPFMKIPFKAIPENVQIDDFMMKFIVESEEEIEKLLLEKFS